VAVYLEYSGEVSSSSDRSSRDEEFTWGGGFLDDKKTADTPELAVEVTPFHSLSLHPLIRESWIFREVIGGCALIEMLMEMFGGRKALEKWPQYYRHLKPDQRDPEKCAVHLNTLEYFFFWTAFYVLKSGQAWTATARTCLLEVAVLWTQTNRVDAQAIYICGVMDQSHTMCL